MDVDEEEQRQLMRRTLINSSEAESTLESSHEQSEDLKKCLEIYQENKMSRENVWLMPVIDTFLSLLERHHKALNNFSVAGSSLEMSSRVYGMRVDSVYADVVRMAAGLNVLSFRENQDHHDDGGVLAICGSVGALDPNTGHTNTAAKKRKKKPRATVTRNKETLNAHLDTVSMQISVFNKLNAFAGSKNASCNLMNNVLSSVDAELQLGATSKFWRATDVDEDCDYNATVEFDEIMNAEWLPCERLARLGRFEGLLLRPLYGGYVISDEPLNSVEDQNEAMRPLALGHDGGFFDNPGETSMAFDINAESEPLPQLDAYAPILDVDVEDFEEYTAEEHNAMGHCGGLRKAVVVIDDMRPIDSTSKLEYSYRPVERISKFWAGPSYWRFRRWPHPSSTMTQSTANSQHHDQAQSAAICKRGRNNARQSKKHERIDFAAAPLHESLFVKLDSKFKSRRANITKKWNPKNLLLPKDYQVDAIFLHNRCFAPGFSRGETSTPPATLQDGQLNATADYGEGAAAGDGEDFLANVPTVGETAPTNVTSNAVDQNNLNEDNATNDTILEWATDIEFAPPRVTKIVVPFAKRDKFIDMKNLKRNCSRLITQQFENSSALNESQLPPHPLKENENYAPGVASFKGVYKRLPDGVSMANALYAILHLASDCDYRLMPQDGQEDFGIREIGD